MGQHADETFERLRALRARLFPKGVRRWSIQQKARVMHRTTEQDFVLCFRQLHIAPGSVICVHAAMSGFGYLPDGIECAFSALQTAVPGCTIMMPSFPFSETTLKYLDSGGVFDPRTTPSASGRLSEALRLLAGVRRGAHPTHACLALGPRADELLDGTECSPTPFGDDSTYGRYSRLPNAVLLLLHTNSTSHVHRLQELVDWPHLFLDGFRTARAVGSRGEIRKYQVRVHRPRLPLYAVLPGANGRPQYLWLPDYAVLFPASRQGKVLSGLGSGPGADMLKSRQEEWARDGVTRTARCGPGEVMAIDLQPWQERLCGDLRASFTEWAEAYSLESLTRAQNEGLLR
jgi:aminoglycoside N3'-acetyltransferase